jgi:hypothetical protein
MSVYILSSEAISCQDTFGSEGMPDCSVQQPTESVLRAQTPDYKQYIDARLIRRMSSVLRMGVATASACLKRAGVEKPDSIVVGTGLGCMDDTVRFLDLLIENDEQMLNPTPFIQSTHNTIAGQIALMLGCRGHNLTFSQKNLSFASSLLESAMLIEEGEAGLVLTGAVDELNDTAFALMQEADCADNEIFYSEGASFFLLSKDPNGALAKLDDIEVFSKAGNRDELIARLDAFLKRNQLTKDNIDLLVSGRTGDASVNSWYKVSEEYFAEASLLYYKKLCGEYMSAAGFAMFMAHRAIITGQVPASVLARKVEGRDIKNVLIFSYNKNAEFSLILLRKV